MEKITICRNLTTNNKCRLCNPKDPMSWVNLSGADIDGFCLTDPYDFDVMCECFVQDKARIKQ